MTIQINGKPVEIGGDMTVTQLLTNRKVKMPDMVSVELNGEILSRGTFDSVSVKDGDKVEFLYFMGGGREAGERDTTIVKNRHYDLSTLRG